MGCRIALDPGRSLRLTIAVAALCAALAFQLAGAAPALAEPPVITEVVPGAGPTSGDTDVVIWGDFFYDPVTFESNVVSVTFGGVPAIYEWRNPAQIDAISPPHAAGTVDVVVKTKEGTSTPMNGPTGDDFTYWATPPGGFWSFTRPMLSPRKDHTQTLLDGPACRAAAPPSYCGDVLVIGGTDTSVELYDPTLARWRAGAEMSVPRTEHNAVLLDGPECHAASPPSYCGKVLAIGGSDPVDVTASVELYDPATRTWQSEANCTLPDPPPPAPNAGCPAPMGTARYRAATVLLQDGTVLVAGGQTPGGVVDTAEIYNPATGTWSATTGNMTTPRRLHAATVLENGKVILADGKNALNQTLKTTELYDPVSKTFAATGDTAITRYLGQATRLPSGKVLLTGGLLTNGVGTKDSELYNPATGMWEPTGSTKNKHAGGGLTSLADGRVLLFGGQNLGNPTVILSSSEIYDPATGKWSYTAPLNRARLSNYNFATLLKDGRVLAAGGGSFTGFTLDTAEIFTPVKPGAATATPPPVVGPGPSTRALAGCPARAARRQIAGTAANNVITGTLGADLIFAEAGDDQVDALAGDDCVDLGAGDDRAKGGSGSDYVVGRGGDDRANGGAGNDTLLGNSGRDRLNGNSGRDRLFGAAGKDRLSGGSGADRLSGGAGADRLGGGAGADRLGGGAGADRLGGGSGKDRLTGGSGKDRLAGGSGNDRIAGGSGRDRISCGSGRDVVIGAGRGDRVARDCEVVKGRRR